MAENTDTDEKLDAEFERWFQSETPPPPPPAEWLDALAKFIAMIDPRDAERAQRDLKDFIEDKKVWAEVQGIPRQLMLNLAEKGYLQFQSGRYAEAEAIFRGLTIWDHHSAYYHTALGAIYQKQQKLIDAIAAYTVALELDPDDVTAYANRGEVYAQLAFAEGIYQQALSDFNAAIARDPQDRDPWAKRARFLKQQILKDYPELET